MILYETTLLIFTGDVFFILHLSEYFFDSMLGENTKSTPVSGFMAYGKLQHRSLRWFDGQISNCRVT